MSGRSLEGEKTPAETGAEKREEPRVLDPRESAPADGAEKSVSKGKQSIRQILLVDPSPALRPALLKCKPQQGSASVVYAATLDEARRLIQTAGRIDLAILPQGTDNDGLEFVRELSESDAATACVLLTSTPDFDFAQQAMRLSVSDLIVRPALNAALDDAWLTTTAARVSEALDRQWSSRERKTRIRKLKKLCRRLNDARLEVTEQVDILCNDLVTAYQELATQMQNMTNTAGYREAIGDELDLEAVLRKTLEYILQQAGPCNAAVFLPSSADEFSLGGYVNYDCTKESADMLLQHLADVLAPGVAKLEDGDLIHATDNGTLARLIGDDWNYLADCHLLALPACHDGEALAVVALFRDNAQPFTEPAVDALSSIAEQMGTLLARIIRVHHRSMPGFDDVTPGDSYLPPSEWQGYDKLSNPFDDEEEDEDDLSY